MILREKPFEQHHFPQLRHNQFKHLPKPCAMFLIKFQYGFGDLLSNATRQKQTETFRPAV
jgi:hypothetical protein